MSLDGAYEESNVFARILRGELPKAQVFEDEATLAFLDIMPQSPGHTLVISKWSKARTILEMEEQALCEVMATIKRLAAAIRKALDPDGMVVVQTNGAPAGQTVFHLHVHIIPRWLSAPAGHDLDSIFVPGRMADPAEQDALAEKIRAAF